MQGYLYQHGDRPLEGYTIQRAIGRGGFGEVYFALSDSGRQVALKVIQGYEQIELRGVGQCMNLKSPHLVSIFDVRHNDQGKPFVIMEYVGGPSLRQILDELPAGLGPQKAAFFLREIGKGLSYLHDCGVVHRDLKPGNIFYEDGYVKIGDYGLSKAMSASRHSGQTITVGTVHYMAPEIGQGCYDRSIDIYAMGCLLYEMLTGQPPYLGSSPGEILMKHMVGEPDLRNVEEPFATAIRRSMAKDPSHRFATVQEMVESVFGAEHVRNSVSHFAPASLSLVAGHVAGKMTGSDAARPAVAEATPPPIRSVSGPGRPGSGTPGPWQPTPTPTPDWQGRSPAPQPAPPPAGRIRRAGYAVRQVLYTDGAAASVPDAMNCWHRRKLALITAAVVAVGTGILSADSARGQVAPPSLLAFLAILGCSAGVLWFHQHYLPRARLEKGLLRRLIGGIVAAGFGLLFVGPLILVAAMDGPGIMRDDWLLSTLVAVGATLVLVEGERLTAPLRRERVTLGGPLWAALIAFIAASVLDGVASLAIGIAAGIGLAVQIASPWDPTRGQGPPRPVPPNGGGGAPPGSPPGPGMPLTAANRPLMQPAVRLDLGSAAGTPLTPRARRSSLWGVALAVEVAILTGLFMVPLAESMTSSQQTTWAGGVLALVLMIFLTALALRPRSAGLPASPQPASVARLRLMPTYGRVLLVLLAGTFLSATLVAFGMWDDPMSAGISWQRRDALWATGFSAVVMAVVPLVMAIRGRFVSPWRSIVRPLLLLGLFATAVVAGMMAETPDPDERLLSLVVAVFSALLWVVVTVVPAAWAEGVGARLARRGAAPPNAPATALAGLAGTVLTGVGGVLLLMPFLERMSSMEEVVFWVAGVWGLLLGTPLLVSGYRRAKASVAAAAVPVGAAGAVAAPGVAVAQPAAPSADFPRRAGAGPALALACVGFVGVCGLHRIYVGKVFTGILWLATLGLLGVGQVVDGVLILAGQFTDRCGRRLTWDDEPAPAPTEHRSSLAALAQSLSPRRVARGVARTVADLLVLGSVLVGVATAVDMPGAVEAGLFGRQAAAELTTIFGYSPWSPTVHQIGTLLSVAVMLAGASVLVIARHRDGGPHMLRAAVGPAGMLIALAIFDSAMRLEDWSYVVLRAEQGQIGLALERFVGGIGEGRALLAAVVLLTGIVILAWPPNRKNEPAGAAGVARQGA